MAAVVSNAGGLGSIGVGGVDANATRQMIAEVRARTTRSFNVNVFCHQPAAANADREAAWLAKLAPEFAQFGVEPPTEIREIYQSFTTDDEKLAVLVEEKPAVVSFHFGLPSRERIAKLRSAGIVLLATATSLAEGAEIVAAGVDAIVAQGYEAGGHRGVFDPDAPDDQLGTMALTRLLVNAFDIPVIVAGGIMDGAGIAAALALGASAAQLGTAFVACSESSADKGFQAALQSSAAHHTVMTRAISGRPARCLANRFTALGNSCSPNEIPDYPIAYDAGKALHAMAKERGEYGYGPQWAGQGAPLVRSLSASDLMAQLKHELEQTQRQQLDN